MTLVRHTCATCGVGFPGSPKGPRVRYCADCGQRRQRRAYQRMWDQWPLERRRAHWRIQKAKQRLRIRGTA